MQFIREKFKGTKGIAFLAVLIMMFMFSQVAWAKGASSGGRSSGGSSSRSSYSGSSTSRSIPKSYSSDTTKSSSTGSGYSSSTSGYSSGSGGYSGSSQSTKTSKTDPVTGNNFSSTNKSNTSSSNQSTQSTQKPSTASAQSQTKKDSYMQEAYKKELSKSNYAAYKQKLDENQQKAYDQTANRSYTMNNKMDWDDAMATRQQRMGRFDGYPVRTAINISMFPGSFGYGSSFIGPYDLWFLARASDLFWYHHWDLLSPYRSWFDPVGFAAREAMIHQMEMQHIQRNPDYMDSDWDYDLAFSPDYQRNHLGDLYNTRRAFHGFWTSIWIFIVMLGIVILIVFMIRKISESRHKNANSFRPGNSIY